MNEYNLIVVDPPWPIKKISNKQRPNQISMDYPLMDLDQIYNLKIKDISTNDSWCFLWTTQKYIFDSKKIIENWGFKYKLMMVWEKTYGKSAGMPLYGFRWNAEFIAVGYNGAKPMFPKQKLIPAVFQAENIRHSEKPDRFYQLIENLGTNKIDIFARKERQGWDVWGNEVKNSVNLNIISGYR